MSCSNNLKQLGLALQNYHDTNNRFPFGSRGGITWAQAGIKDGTNWRTSILPYLEQSAVYNRLNFGGSFGAGTTAAVAYMGGNQHLSNFVLPTYRCPSSALELFPQTYITNTGGTGSFNNPGNGMGIIMWALWEPPRILLGRKLAIAIAGMVGVAIKGS